MFLGAVLAQACLVATVLAATYTQSDSFSGTSFLSGFTHQAIPDPTNGRVYVHFSDLQ